jgi:hypothetical protein
MQYLSRVSDRLEAEWSLGDLGIAPPCGDHHRIHPVLVAQHGRRAASRSGTSTTNRGSVMSTGWTSPTDHMTDTL